MKRIAVLLIALWVGSLFLTQSPAVHQGLTSATHQGDFGGVLVGLALCVPIFGMFMMVRTFRLWHRSFHIRMQEEGLVRRRDGARS